MGRIGLRSVTWLAWSLLYCSVVSCGYLNLHLAEDGNEISVNETIDEQPTPKVTPTPFYYFSRTLSGTGQKLVYLNVNKIGEAFAFGYFKDALDVSYGLGAPEVRTSKGDADAFITKFDADGRPLWTRTFGGTGQDLLMAISFTESNEIIATGRFSSTVDFSTDPTNPLIQTSRGFNEGFVLKLSKDGETQWIKTMGGAGARNIATDIAINTNGDLYVTGSVCGTCDFDPSNAQYVLSSPSCDAYFLRLDKQGTFMAANTFGGTSYDWGLRIVTDKNDNAHVSFGNLYNQFNFQTFSAANAGNGDNGVVSIDPAGAVRWGNLIGSSGWDGGGQIRIDSAGNLYIISIVTNKSAVNYNNSGKGSADSRTVTGSYALAVTKMSSSGEYLWTTLLDADSSTASITAGYGADLNYAPVTTQSFSLTNEGRFLMTGLLSGTSTFSLKRLNDSSQILSDLPGRFILELNPENGALVRFRRFELPAGTNYSVALTSGARSDQGQDLFIYGMFRGANFDLNISGAPGTNPDNRTSSTTLVDDFFFTKLRWE